MRTLDLPSEQYLRLVEQLGEELGKKRGWMTAVARRLGIHRSTLVKIVRRERPVTATLIDRAIEELGLDVGFFAEGARGDHYTRWVAGAPRPAMARIDAAARGAWDATLRASGELSAVVIHRGSVEEIERRLAALLSAVSELPLFAAVDDAREALLQRDRSREAVELAAMRLIVTLEKTISGLAVAEK